MVSGVIYKYIELSFKKYMLIFINIRDDYIQIYGRDIIETDLYMCRPMYKADCQFANKYDVHFPLGWIK